MYIIFTFLLKTINLLIYIFNLLPKILILTLSFICNLINNCIINIIINIKHIRLIPCMDNNKPSKGLVLDEISSRSLFTIVLVELLLLLLAEFLLIASKALALFMWLNPDCTRPPINAPPPIIAAF